MQGPLYLHVLPPQPRAQVLQLGHGVTRRWRLATEPRGEQRQCHPSEHPAGRRMHRIHAAPEGARRVEDVELRGTGMRVPG